MSDKNDALQGAIRAAAENFLKETRVNMVIGYGVNSLGETCPEFVRDMAHARELVWNNSCFHNLTTYLSREHIKKYFPVGIVVKGCDMKAVNMLLKENVIQREDVVVIGVPCSGMGDPVLEKCKSCEVQDPVDADEKISGTPDAIEGATDEDFANIREIEDMSPGERWAVWQEQFEKCVRCYACRQVCPMCYCKRCIAEKTQPQWIESSQHLRGNFAWNAIRAFHLAGRCVGCGECERVCPAEIPLSKLNSNMAKYMLETYDYQAGADDKTPTPFTTFDLENDNDEGIL
jgi:formate dehydrogenase subunit beta